MRKQLNVTEGIFPMPVLLVATYNEDGSVNVMNAAWGTMQERDTVALNLTETHKTVQNIKARGAFTVSIADAAHVAEADYFGVTSGNQVSDKLAGSGLTATRSEVVDAPILNEFPPLPGVQIHRVPVQRIWLRRHRQGGAGDGRREGHGREQGGYLPGERHRLRPLHPRLLPGGRAGRRGLSGWPQAEKVRESLSGPRAGGALFRMGMSLLRIAKKAFTQIPRSLWYT